MEQTLREAISSIKSGNKTLGKQLLIAVLEEDDRNETAWLWLTKCLKNPEKKRECFKRVLEINPNNQHAKDGLKRLSTLSTIISSPPTASERSHPKTSPKKGFSITRIIILVLATFTVCLCSVLIATPTPEGDKSQGGDSAPDSFDAYYTCKEIVESLLKAPSTAEFPDYYEHRISTLGKSTGLYENAYRVQGYVDAQNSFGAQIRTDYTCDISYNAEGDWTLLDLNMDE